jgi:hypothetical protein
MNPDMNGGIKRKDDETKAKGCHIQDKSAKFRPVLFPLQRFKSRSAFF